MTEPNENPLSYQVGGSHYSRYEYQPIEFFNDTKLDFNRANAIKYLARWKEKGGVEDLKKALQYIRFAKEEVLKEEKCIKRFVSQFPQTEREIMEAILGNYLWGVPALILDLIRKEESKTEPNSPNKIGF